MIPLVADFLAGDLELDEEALNVPTLWTDEPTKGNPLMANALDGASGYERLAYLDACLEACIARGEQLAKAIKEADKAQSTFEIYVETRSLQIATAKVYPDRRAPEWIHDFVDDTTTKVSRVDAEKFAQAEAKLWWKLSGKGMLPDQQLHALHVMRREAERRAEDRRSQLNAGQTRVRTQEAAVSGRR